MRIEKIIESSGESVEWVFIDNKNGTITQILKSVWDEQQKAAELGGTLS